MKRMKRTINISVLIAGLFGGMPAFAQNDIEVTFLQGKHVYNIVSYKGGSCAGLTCYFPPDQFNNVGVNNNIGVKLNVNGTTYTCSFTGGKLKLKPNIHYFTGYCPPQVGTVFVNNTPIDPNKPVIVNLP